jgi:hypothetical protein
MVSQQPGPRLPELLFLAVIANLSKVAFSTTIGKLKLQILFHPEMKKKLFCNMSIF